jgi:hypothetical protein
MTTMTVSFRLFLNAERQKLGGGQHMACRFLQSDKLDDLKILILDEDLHQTSKPLEVRTGDGERCSARRNRRSERDPDTQGLIQGTLKSREAVKHGAQP